MFKTELSKIAEELDIQYDSKGKVAFGKHRGYKVAIKEYRKAYVYLISFPIKSSDLSQERNIEVFIQELLQNKKVIKKATYEKYNLKVEIGMKSKAKNVHNILETLNKIENFAKNNYYNSCCESCGENVDTFFYLINDVPLCACEKCYNQVIGELDNAQLSFKNKKSSIVTGIVGAFLGSLIGVGLWVIVYAIGYIAAVCGIVLSVCIIKGYEKFGGKLNKLGVFITIIITICMVFVANYISYGYEVYVAIKETDNINLFQGVKLVFPLLNEYEDVKRAFLADLALGYFFTAIGSISTFVSAYKTRNFKYKTRKLDY